MAFSQPRFWKTLERHPLSAEYPDLPPAAFAAMVAGIKEHGVLDRRVTLHDHDGRPMVLDGWQLLQACIEADVKPEFAPLPKGVTPEEFVSLKNDVRRHETAEKAQSRIEARRERVAAARADGKSIREIAEEEGVSPSTVVKDVEEVKKHRETPHSGVHPRTPEPEKVTGRDGKTYPASKPKPLCDRCSRVGPVDNCARCAELSGAKKKAPQPPNFDDPADTEPEAKPHPKARAGKACYDEKRFKEAYGKLIREVDLRAEMMGKDKHHKTLMELLGAVLEEYKRWMSN